MANQWGYNQIFTDLPEIWQTGGKVTTDGYGEPDFSNVPSGIVHSVVRNSVGNYSILLQQSWYALVFVSVVSELASGDVPDLALTQLESDTVGSTSFGGDGQTRQGVTFQFVDAAGDDVELGADSAFRFLLILKKSSA